MSWRSEKVWPQNRGRVFGKQMAASTWLASMSASRSVLFQEPLRISSKVVGLEADLVEADGGREHHEGRHQVVVVPDVDPVGVVGLDPADARAAATGRAARASSACARPGAPGRAYLAGSRDDQRSGGSTTWSSTEMMRGTSAIESFSVLVGPDLMARAVWSSWPSGLVSSDRLSGWPPCRCCGPSAARCRGGRRWTRRRRWSADPVHEHPRGRRWTTTVSRRLSPGRSKTRRAGPLSTVVGVEAPRCRRRHPRPDGPGRAGRTAGPGTSVISWTARSIGSSRRPRSESARNRVG